MTKVQTKVDELMDFVHKEGRVSLQDAAKHLKAPEATVQAWVDFLVEEHLLGIEYKFTTPYIYVNDEEKLERVEHEDQNYELKDYKNGFYKNAKEKEIPEERIPVLWKEHLRSVLENNKEFFKNECERRSVAGAQELYEEYAEELLNEA